jgi:hypothetical protein
MIFLDGEDTQDTEEAGVEAPAEIPAEEDSAEAVPADEAQDGE